MLLQHATAKCLYRGRLLAPGEAISTAASIHDNPLLELIRCLALLCSTQHMAFEAPHALHPKRYLQAVRSPAAPAAWIIPGPRAAAADILQRQTACYSLGASWTLPRTAC